jgi:ribosomal protein L4
MKKQWKKIIALYNFLIQSYKQSIDKAVELEKESTDNPKLKTEELEKILDTISSEKTKQEAIEEIIEKVQPLIDRNNRLKRQIVINNAMTIKKSGQLMKDERGEFCYTAEGLIKMEEQQAELADKEVDFNDIIPADSVLLSNNDFKILKEFIYL